MCKIFALSIAITLSMILASQSIAMYSVNEEYILSSHITTSISTPQAYEKYLTKQARFDPEALKTKKQFSAMPKKDKEQFIRYITNTKIIGEIISKMITNTKEETERESWTPRKMELYDGDIILRHDSSSIPVGLCKERLSSTSVFFASFFINEISAAPAAIKDFKVTDTKTLVIKGIKVMQVSAWVFYKVRGMTVTETISGGAYFHNSIPLWSVEKQSVETGVFQNKAQTCGVYKAKSIALFGLWPMDISTVHHDVLGFANGKKTYRFWR